MGKQWVAATGYLAIFLMPALFVVGAIINEPWLAFGVVVFVFPLARLAFGALPEAGAPEWREDVATFLDRLPLAYAVVLPICVLTALHLAAEPIDVGAIPLVGLGLSLWMTLLFGTCVAHDLVHRRSKWQATIGHVLAAFCGYPALGIEHLAHHARPGDTAQAEYPSKGESVWRFAGRRLWRIGREFFGTGAPIWSSRRQTPNLVRGRIALLVTGLTWMSFALLAGPTGAWLYLGMLLAVAFGVQLITYIQHWALGDDSIPDRVAYGRGWEDDCRFQAWVTLGISIHDQHHRDSRRPYYRLELSPDSPRSPAGYVLLMFASLIPGVWRKAMAPAYSRWLAAPASPLSAGRRLMCFGLQGLEGSQR